MSDRYEPLALRNQLCFPICLCAREIVKCYTPLLNELNLTYTQYIVMLFFWERGASNVRELGEGLRLDPSTLTPVLKKLERKGYLTRARSEVDERSLIIRLTPAGEQLKDAALAVPEKMRQCLDLSEEESALLSALIGKILSKTEGGTRHVRHGSDPE